MIHSRGLGYNTQKTAENLQVMSYSCDQLLLSLHSTPGFVRTRKNQIEVSSGAVNLMGAVRMAYTTEKTLLSFVFSF